MPDDVSLAMIRKTLRRAGRRRTLGILAEPCYTLYSEGGFLIAS